MSDCVHWNKQGQTVNLSGCNWQIIKERYRQTVKLQTNKHTKDGQQVCTVEHNYNSCINEDDITLKKMLRVKDGPRTKTNICYFKNFLDKAVLLRFR